MLYKFSNLFLESKMHLFFSTIPLLACLKYMYCRLKMLGQNSQWKSLEMSLCEHLLTDWWVAWIKIGQVITCRGKVRSSNRQVNIVSVHQKGNLNVKLPGKNLRLEFSFIGVRRGTRGSCPPLSPHQAKNSMFIKKIFFLCF